MCASDLNVCIYSSPVFGDLIRIFGYPPTLAPTVFQPKKQLTMPPQLRTFQLRLIKKSTTMSKAMKSLSPLNLRTSQIRNEEQNLRPSKRQEPEK
jgi:hypothetical protein